jgi:curved DNA-binding protein CbpA
MRKADATLANIGRDPKGYYVVLGIAEDADAAAIKSAFRSRAKRLHPDFNPSPVAAKQFNRLHEAYATLSDPKKRRAYDRPWKREAAAQFFEERANATAAAGRASETTEKPRPRAETAPQVRPQPSEFPSARGSDILIPVACRCGQITAQPRFVIYDMVWGRLGRVHRRSLSGIYCRSCADKTALRASFVSWLAGWWSWPHGPRETVRALVNNIRGGRKPADRNARLLIRQARAFQKRGDNELARSAAGQAKQFARNPVLQREIADLLVQLGPGTGRVLKDRWSRPGWAPMLQVMPLALIVGILAATVWLSIPSSHSAPLRPVAQAAVARPKPAPPPVREAKPRESAAGEDASARQAYFVAMDQAPLRTGPAETFHIVSSLKFGTPVTALEVDPRGDWVRVALDDGSTGFVALVHLRPGAAKTPTNALTSER